MGLRVGGSVGGLGGSVGSGGTYVRLGPVSVGGRIVPRGTSRHAGPVLAAAALIVAAVVLMPVALAAFWLWERRQWTAAGRPPLASIHPRDRAFLVASRAALPVAVAWAVVAWGGLYSNVANLELLPDVRRTTVAEARAALADAGFDAEFAHAGGLAPLSDDCEVRHTPRVEYARGRFVDRRQPVPVDAYCTIGVTRMPLGEARDVVAATGMAVEAVVTSGDGALSDDCEVRDAESDLTPDALTGTMTLHVYCPGESHRYRPGD